MLLGPRAGSPSFCKLSGLRIVRFLQQYEALRGLNRFLAVQEREAAVLDGTGLEDALMYLPVLAWHRLYVSSRELK
jgi:hypothetical protein